jgi:RNA recognition motif-containing protein
MITKLTRIVCQLFVSHELSVDSLSVTSCPSIICQSSMLRNQIVHFLIQSALMADDLTKLIFLGNLPVDIKREQIKEFFDSGNISLADEDNAIDIKVNYAFIRCLADEYLDENIARLNGASMLDFPNRPMTVQHAKADAQELKRKLERRNERQTPTACLFVVGYDPIKTKPHYLEYEFESVAKVKRVEMMKTFSYVFFNKVDDATAVLNHFNGKELFGKTLVIEYKTSRGEPGTSRRDGFPDRGRERDYAYMYDRPSSSYPPIAQGRSAPYDDRLSYRISSRDIYPHARDLPVEYRAYSAYDYDYPPRLYDEPYTVVISEPAYRVSNLPPHRAPYPDIYESRRPRDRMPTRSRYLHTLPTTYTLLVAT